MTCVSLLLLAALAAPEALPDPSSTNAPSGGGETESAESSWGRVGAGVFHRLDQVTVVYPTAGNLERNRRSAELRAGVLRSSGVEVRVRGDDLAPGERRGHLLLLGWDNRLLRGDDRVSPLVRRSAEGFDFLGIREPSRDRDLLFAAASPYDADAFIGFWSRIDPELDRFMPIPLIGSDWAVFERFLPVRQGMFASVAPWPPARNEEAEKDHQPDLRAERAERSTRRSEHYILDHHPARVDAARAEAILAAREQALVTAARRLGASIPDRFRVRLFVYADRETKQRLCGVPDAVHSVPRDTELHMLLRHAASTNPHEELHLLAHRHYGTAYLTSLYEGLAFYHLRRFKGMEPEMQAAVLIERGGPPAVATLLDEGKLRALHPDVRFPAMGLFVRWLAKAHGDDALAAAYRLESGGPEELARAIRAPAGGLDAAFHGWLAELAAGQERQVAFLKALAEAENHMLVADYASMAGAMRRALEIRPDAPEALHGLASAEMRLGKYAEAAARLTRILELDLAADSRFRVLAHFDLGRIHDVEGRREQALAHYRRVLELPDQFGVHQLARDGIVQPVTPENLQ